MQVNAVSNEADVIDFSAQMSLSFANWIRSSDETINSRDWLT
jgi:hypothetical protein